MSARDRGTGRASRRERPRRNPAESPLSWLHSRRDRDGRRLIGDAQLEAGERFHADFMRASLSPRLTSGWSPPPARGRAPRGAPGFGVELADSIVSARQRINSALSAVGPELAGLIVDVCGFQHGLERAEQAMRLPQRSGKVVLSIALTILARHYGILRQPGSPAEDRLHWGSADYRPSLETWRSRP